MLRIGLALLCTSLLAATPAPDDEQSTAERDPVTSTRPQNRFGHVRPFPRTPGAIRIASYNVLNLFDHADDPALTGEWEDMEMATSDARCRAIADAIRAVDADVIGLQEVESLECLTWFRDTYLADLGYDHMASEDVGYMRGVECSVLSRFPITHVETWPQQSLDDVPRPGPGWSTVPHEASEAGLTYRRSPMRVDVKVSDDYELTLFVLHHKSGRDYRFQREHEAARTIQHVKEIETQDPARNVIVLGDFNAAPWDKSVRLYLEAGMIDTLGHRVIPRWRNPDLTEANLFKTHESARVIDYILMNSAAHRELVVGSPHVFGTLFDEDYDWREDPFPAGYAADHYPVIVEVMPGDRL